MTGNIYKRGSTWTVRYDEPSPDGRRRQRSKGGFRTRREAQRFLAEQLARIDGGSYAQPSRLTVGEYLTGEWLPAVEPHAAPAHAMPATRTSSGSTSCRRSAQCGSRRSRAGHLNALYAELERAGLSVATRRLVHAVLGRALRDAERWGRVPRNVARMADPPARARSRATSWTASELRRFLEHVRGRPSVRALAAGGDHGDAAGRAARPHLADARPRGRTAVRRAAARPDPWRRLVRPAEVGPVPPHGRARPRDGRGLRDHRDVQTPGARLRGPTPTRTTISSSAISSAARSTRLG